jgi:hypothetical protein
MARTLIAASSPVFADAAHTMVRLKATFAELPQFPNIDFVAMPNDAEDHGKNILARALAGEFGSIAAYVPPSIDLVAYAEDRRWRKETGGITVSGIPVAMPMHPSPRRGLVRTASCIRSTQRR